jgi:hypothetical protein
MAPRFDFMAIKVYSILDVGNIEYAFSDVQTFLVPLWLGVTI